MWPMVPVYQHCREQTEGPSGSSKKRSGQLKGGAGQKQGEGLSRASRWRGKVGVWFAWMVCRREGQPLVACGRVRDFKSVLAAESTSKSNLGVI